MNRGVGKRYLGSLLEADDGAITDHCRLHIHVA